MGATVARESVNNTSGGKSVVAVAVVVVVAVAVAVVVAVVGTRTVRSLPA
jgi:hypothetical protein